MSQISLNCLFPPHNKPAWEFLLYSFYRWANRGSKRTTNFFFFWVNSTPSVGLGLTTLRSKIPYSMYWARQAPPQRTNNLSTITQLGSSRYWTWGQVFLTPKSFPCHPDIVWSWENLIPGLMGEQAEQPANISVGRGDVLSPSTVVKSPKALFSSSCALSKRKWKLSTLFALTQRLIWEHWLETLVTSILIKDSMSPPWCYD